MNLNICAQTLLPSIERHHFISNCWSGENKSGNLKRWQHNSCNGTIFLLTGKMECDHTFKIIIIGDSGVGKSCLLVRFADQSYMDHYVSSVGIEYKFKTLEIYGKTVTLKICDTMGQERFKAVSSQYIRGADGIIVVYDTTDYASFVNLEKWFKDISDLSKANSKVMLVGAKLDDSNGRCVPKDVVENYAKVMKVQFIETSAKTGLNVDIVFEEIAKMLLEAAGHEVVEADTIRLEDSKNADGTQQRCSWC